MTERELVIERGSHVKTRMLLEQSSYTVKLAREDLVTLQRVGLRAELLNDAERMTKELATLNGKHETTKDAVSLSTVDVNEKLTEAKEWIIKAKLKAKRVFRLNKTALADFFTMQQINSSVPRVIAAMVKLIELNKKYSDLLALHGGGAAFAAEGERILRELQDIDSTQERAKGALPESSQELYYRQGLLYYRLKDINDMGREAFISDPVKAGQYNMVILKRGGSRRKEETVG